jgi:hypothetical protein
MYQSRLFTSLVCLLLVACASSAPKGSPMIQQLTKAEAENALLMPAELARAKVAKAFGDLFAEYPYLWMYKASAFAKCDNMVLIKLIEFEDIDGIEYLESEQQLVVKSSKFTCDAFNYAGRPYVPGHAVKTKFSKEEAKSLTKAFISLGARP